MNISFVTSSAIWSGVKTWMLEFGQALGERGHAVHVMASDERFLAACREHGLHAHAVRFGPDYSPASIVRFSRLLRRLEIDVTCMNLQKDLRTAGLAARWLGIPVVHRIGLVTDLTAKLDAVLTYHGVVDGVLVSSRWLRDALLSTHRYLDADRVHTVYNGRATKFPPPTHTKRNPVRFVAASRLAPDKNQHDLLAAFAQLRSQGIRDFTCDVFGDGPMEARLRQAIQDLHLAGAVRLRGFTPRLEDELPNYDFGLLPSRKEALSNTLLEFQAAGLPVVASQVGAVAEVVRPGLSGFLFVPGDVTRLTELLGACIAMDSARYDSMARAARAAIQQRFQLEKLAGQLESFFRDLVNRTAQRRSEHGTETA